MATDDLPVVVPHLVARRLYGVRLRLIHQLRREMSSCCWLLAALKGDDGC
jgi:hypothetical protein